MVWATPPTRQIPSSATLINLEEGRGWSFQTTSSQYCLGFPKLWTPWKKERHISRGLGHNIWKKAEHHSLYGEVWFMCREVPATAPEVWVWVQISEQILHGTPTQMPWKLTIVWVPKWSNFQMINIANEKRKREGRLVVSHLDQIQWTRILSKLTYQYPNVWLAPPPFCC